MAQDSKIKALVVTKEKELGLRSIAVLEGKGYHCIHIAARSAATRTEVQKELARTRYDLVVAQQHMSPYSAADLLDDVKAADEVGRLAVVCLAMEERARNPFIRAGGAGFVCLEPELDFAAAIAEGLLQVHQFCATRAVSKANVLRALDRYTGEDEFRRFALEMFRELKYGGVRLTHGQSEKGKDIVCWEVNRLGRKEYLGIQAKYRNVSGAASKRGITELWNQAIEALRSRVDFGDGEERHLDKFVVMVSGTFNEAARDKLTEFLQTNHLNKRVFFLDREEIADVVVFSCPELLAKLE